MAEARIRAAIFVDNRFLEAQIEDGRHRNPLLRIRNPNLNRIAK
jgi:hypothetical protein